MFLYAGLQGVVIVAYQSSVQLYIYIYIYILSIRVTMFANTGETRVYIVRERSVKK